MAEAARRRDPPGRDGDFDVCIVGGGVAGALVAWKLGRAGVATVVLESGPRHPEGVRPSYMRRYLGGDDPWRTNHAARDRFTNAGEVDYPLNDYRVKAIGGTTLHWIGYTPRFQEGDFRLRSAHGIAEDWPISYRDLEPYYAEAESELGVAGAEDNPFASFRSTGYPLPGFPVGHDERLLAETAEGLGIRFHTMPQARNSIAFAGRPACQTYSVCRACPIGAKYDATVHVALAESTGSVRVLDDATVVRLESDASGRVRRAVYRSVDGREDAVRARVFVVAAHAVESARLLLLSTSNGHSEGLGNSSGLVGRHFMEHMGQYRYAELDRPLYPNRKGFMTLFSQQFTESPRRGEESGFLLRGDAGGPSAAAVIADTVRRSGLWGGELERELEAEFEHRFGRRMLIGTNAEPLPSEDNRVELDPVEVDHFGNPAPRLWYSITDYERRGYERGEDVIRQVADALGARALSSLHNHFGGHHAGTCRMGDDPDRSVVNRDLRCHDSPNAYVVGSSNFVTLGHVNPTLTIAALALRLGDHLLAAPVSHA